MTTIENMFDPAHYKNVRLPALEAETLPTWCYTSQEFYNREVESMFKKAWNFIGREDEIPKPGDYMVLELFGESIIVIRDKGGNIRALANTCRHRGTRLLEGTGHCSAIMCPYHSWAYGLGGELIGAPGMEKTINFDKRKYGLIPIRLESWAGFLFVTFNPNSESLRDYLADLPEKLASHNLSNMVCVRRREFDLACNWKIYLENAMEEYHTPTVHRQSIGKQMTNREESRGQWNGLHMPAENSIALLAEDLDNAFPPIPTLQGKAASGT